MKYAEWLGSVPCEVANDPIWKLEVYRLALFAGDIGWNDVLALSKTKLMYSIADQLHRSLGSISANLTEGYSRSKALDRARYLEIALGSARARGRSSSSFATRTSPTRCSASGPRRSTASRTTRSRS